MVLSNRRLKQQLRQKISDSLLTFEIVKSDPSSNDGSDPNPNPQPQSMRALLGSATQKPTLSKRAKRRKLAALRGPATSGGGGDTGVENGKSGALGLERNGDLKMEIGSGSFGVEKKKKKRKSGDLGLEENGELEIGDESLGKKKKKEKKRKRNEEEEKSGDLSSEENGGVKEAKKPKKKKPKWKKKKEAKGEEEKGFQVVREEKKGVVVVREEQSVDETSKEAERQENAEFATKVYVGGIPYYSTEDDIRSYFESCGSITDIDCMRFPDTGKFNGIAIITFRTEAAAKRALALDGDDMGGLFLKILPYKTTRVDKVVNKVSDFAPKLVEGYNRIYVGNLSWDITEDELRKLFSDCKISSINFGMDKETGEFRGYAHVEFLDSLSLTMALKLDQKVVLGRPVKISCAVPLRKPGIHPKSESTSTGTLSQAVATTASAGADNAGLSAISGKLKRRTCYVCGEKGHVSSLCPLKQQVTVIETNASDTKPVTTTSMLSESVTTSTEAANTELSSVSGKIKRRTCYECGEKGHVSTACPQKQSSAALIDTNATFTTPVHTITSPALESIAVTPSTGVDNTGLSSISGKIKRRTCYECGEKGHVATACPNTQYARPNTQYARPIESPARHTKPVPTTPTPLLEPAATEPDNTGLSSMSGKIKRRTCYECGEKGHISSACPKKQS